MVTAPLQIYHLKEYLDGGASGLIYKAVEESSGKVAAVKKSRVSQRVKRPILQYEGKVLQLLQGHSAIPALYGYAQMPHFEYLAMELLGQSIRAHVDGPVASTTTSRVVYQMLSALEHIHNHGFIHRDIKPEHMLLSLTDPSKIILVDFGLARRINQGEPSKPRATRRHRISRLYGLYLLRGSLPWKRNSNLPRQGYLKSMRRIYASKAATSGEKLGNVFPANFSYLLDYSHQLECNYMPDYEDLKQRFALVKVEGPLDWRPVAATFAKEEETSDPELVDKGDDDSMNQDGYDGDEIERGDSSEENFSDSYYGTDIADYFLKGARDRDLTLPAEQDKLAAGTIPAIGVVT